MACPEAASCPRTGGHRVSRGWWGQRRGRGAVRVKRARALARWKVMLNSSLFGAVDGELIVWGGRSGSPIPGGARHGPWAMRGWSNAQARLQDLCADTAGRQQASAAAGLGWRQHCLLLRRMCVRDRSVITVGGVVVSFVSQGAWWRTICGSRNRRFKQQIFKCCALESESGARGACRRAPLLLLALRLFKRLDAFRRHTPPGSKVQGTSVRTPVG